MFKDILKNLLILHGLSQRDLAKGADIPTATISGWLNYNKLPDYTAIRKLSLFFNIPPDYLLGMTDEWGNTTDIQKSPVELPADKKELLTVYDSLSPARKQDVLTLVKSFASADASKK